MRRGDELADQLGLEGGEKLEIFASTLRELSDMLGGELSKLSDLRNPLTSRIADLKPDLLGELEGEVDASALSLEECQAMVQGELEKSDRKSYAAYYTTGEGRRAMASFAESYLEKEGLESVVMADPFMGSGRTLTTAMGRIGADRVALAWGVEPYPLSALVGLAALLKSAGGVAEKVTVVCGDAFAEIAGRRLFGTGKLPDADLILTNPPFTRWRNMEQWDRERMLKTVRSLGYRADPGTNLQVLSMLLADRALKVDGLLVAVLPSSTFYTIYGESYKELLASRYQVLALLGSGEGPALSDDSAFEEVLLAALREGRERRGWRTAVGELGRQKILPGLLRGSEGAGEIAAFDLGELPPFLYNWLGLLGGAELRDDLAGIFCRGLDSGALSTWGSDSKLIRGVEMYGPGFFFLPNDHWELASDSGGALEVERAGGGPRLRIPRRYLRPTLRRPALYAARVDPEVGIYALCVPKGRRDLPEDLRRYLRWGRESGEASPAVERWGPDWPCHIEAQMRSKRPCGRVFIPDKVDLRMKRRAVYANYSPKPLPATKNFYIFKGGEAEAELLAGWMNSVFYLAALAQFGRRISSTWTRLLLDDHLRMPRPGPEFDAAPVREALRGLLGRDLGGYWDRGPGDPRSELDLAVAESLGEEDPARLAEKVLELARRRALGGGIKDEMRTER
jgi:hypothetical protein